jgi:hypothetical protein
MQFTHKGNAGIDIDFEDTDSDTEKRIAEQAIALVRNILIALREAKEEEKQ